MATVTTTATKKGRINILADGEYRFTVSAFFWAKSGIRQGEDLPEQALSELYRQAEEEKAYDKALRLLGLRAHGEKELFRKLRQTCSAEASEAALARCRENGLTDDAAFAEALALSLSERRGLSPEGIVSALIQRGVDRETAKNAVQTLDIDRKSGIIKIIEKMRLTQPLSKKDLARMLRRLTAAGYTMREIRETVEFNVYETD